jgi:hypothetical protein
MLQLVPLAPEVQSLDGAVSGWALASVADRASGFRIRLIPLKAFSNAAVSPCTSCPDTACACAAVIGPLVDDIEPPPHATARPATGNASSIHKFFAGQPSRLLLPVIERISNPPRDCLRPPEFQPLLTPPRCYIGTRLAICQTDVKISEKTHDGPRDAACNF